MTTIRLLDARRGLHQQCESLFRDKTVADQIYWYLCDGLEGCDEVEPEREKGEWEVDTSGYGFWVCSACGFPSEAHAANMLYNYCPNCGADMREREEE